MTNHERAEKIRDLFKDEGPVPNYLMPDIEAVISEAVREAVQDTIATLAVEKASYDQGFASAREKAAGIADEYIPGKGLTIAESIRGMTNEN